jgi:hypothetical protein
MEFFRDELENSATEEDFYLPRSAVSWKIEDDIYICNIMPRLSSSITQRIRWSGMISLEIQHPGLREVWV